MIDFKLTGRVGEIVIRRPDAGNAMTGDMVARLAGVMVEARDQADLVTLTGEGEDFTIGRDRKEPKSGTPFETFSKVGDLNRAMADFPGIVIAVVRGRAHGLGVSLTLRSDLAIAASDARFRLDEVEHGIPPMFVMERIAALPAKHALDMVLSGREFSAGEALTMGLVSRVAAAASLDGAASELVAALAARDTAVVRTCKRYLRSVAAIPLDGRPAFALLEQVRFAMSRS